MNKLSYLLIILAALLAANCKDRDVQYQYPTDKSISDENGIPKDSTVTNYPRALINGDSLIEIWPNNAYYASLSIAEEPILYNYYLGHDIYRFTWLRSFDEPVFLTINRKSDEYWMTVKLLNKPYIIPPGKIVSYPHNVHETVKNALEKHEQMMDSFNRSPKLILDQRIRITKREWDNFQSLIKACNYWSLQPSDPNPRGLDGSNWIIEAHFKDRYWVVERWTPNDRFRDCGEFLIKLSGLREEIY